MHGGAEIASSIASRACGGRTVMADIRQPMAWTQPGSGDAFDEVERGLGDLAPTVIDGERVAAVRNLDDLGHAGVVLLTLVRGVRDRPRDGVVLLAVDD